MKHGYREDSAFPKPAGNPAQVNEHGQKVLESILNHPERQVISGEFERYGQVVDIYAPNIGGARYNINGEFIGFFRAVGNVYGKVSNNGCKPSRQRTASC